MPGFLDTLRNLGDAHQRHVQALREAMEIGATQAARDHLARYLQGLSAPALMGFRASVGVLIASEQQRPQVQQALQWVLANVDGLREGRFAAVTPETLPRHGLSVEQVATLLEPWAALADSEAEAQFVATLRRLDAQGRQEFAGHLETLAAQAAENAKRLEAQEDDTNAWGTSFEDRMAYMQAHIASGTPRPGPSPELLRQREVHDALLRMAAAARQWREPATAPAPAPAAARPVPAPAAAAPEAASAAPANASMPPMTTADGVDLSGFPADGPPSAQMAFMRAMLEREKAGGRMDTARAAALADFIDQTTEALRTSEGRERRANGDDASLEDRKADLRDRMTDLAALRERTERFRQMHRDVRRTEALPEGSRAAAVRRRLDALVDDVAGLASSPLLARREAEAEQVRRLHAELIGTRGRVEQLAASDDEVCHFEADALRPLVHTLRLFHRRGHAMIARPLWPGGAARVEPGTVFFAGPAGDAAAGVRALLAEACAGRALALADSLPAGTDVATGWWRQLQRAGLVVLDLSAATPQVYYQLGQAYALGSELLLLAREGTAIPFDVAQHVITWRDEADLRERLGDAIDDALYGVQTPGLSSLMHPTLQRCRELAARAVGLQHAEVLLGQLNDTVMQPLEFRGALEQFLGQLGNSRLVMLHPRWPAFYPAAGEKRCFVVMPFAQHLAATQAMYRAVDDDLAAAGVQVVRGDEAMGQEIVASIWEETARASHVLVDLTGWNLNVCLELGMADAIGRDVLLIGLAGTPEARFPAVDKRRIHVYGEPGSAEAEAVRAQVRAFLGRPPTLL